MAFSVPHVFFQLSINSSLICSSDTDSVSSNSNSCNWSCVWNMIKSDKPQWQEYAINNFGLIFDCCKFRKSWITLFQFGGGSARKNTLCLTCIFGFCFLWRRQPGNPESCGSLSAVAEGDGILVCGEGCSPDLLSTGITCAQEGEGWWTFTNSRTLISYFLSSEQIGLSGSWFDDSSVFL